MLRKILFLILIVGVVPLVIGLSVFYIDQTGQIKESTGKDFQRSAEEISRKIDVFIKEQFANIKKMSLEPQLEQLLGTNDKQALNALMLSEAKKYNFYDVKIITEQDSDKEDKTLFNYVIGQGRGEYLSTINYSLEKKSFYTDIAVIIPRQEVRAVLKASVPMSAVVQLISSWQAGNAGSARIINIDGMVIMDLRQAEKPYGLNPGLKNTVANLQSGWAQETENKDSMLYGFSPIITSYSVPGGTLGQSKWFVLISQASKQALSNIYKLMARSLLLGIGLIAIITLVGGYITYKFIQPINLLREGAQRIGQGDLEFRLNIKTRDEIEQLSAEFNNMAIKLKDIYAHLEEKIRERTQELETINQRLQKNQVELQAAQGELLSTAEELEYANARMEEQTKELARLSQVKTDFVSMVSHELRTPLAAMKEGVALVSDGSAGEITAMQTKLLTIVATNIDRLARLINDLLDISKIESGKMEMKFKETNIEKLIKSNWEVMNPHARSKNINLILDIENNTSCVCIDIDRIMQVLSNLVNNAIKFTPEHSEVKISAHDKDSQFVEIAVEDKGIGISKDDINKLFQKFQQLDNKGMLRKAGGTGLGLAISKEIVTVHGGNIAVSSEVGKGSRFYFSVPKNLQIITAYKHLETRMQYALKNDMRLAVIMLEIPNHGQAAEVMEILATIVRRPTDKIEYLGNKEIIIILDADRNGARIIVERIEQNIRVKYKLKIGISVFPEDTRLREELVSIAKKGWELQNG